MNEPPTPNPDPAIEPPPTKRRVWTILVQLIGFAGGIGALWWAVRLAMSEENRDQLSRLSDASPVELLALMALATISVGFNGIIFWILINPVHRLRATDVISTNAIATFLAYLPFKLSVVSRFVIHNRRDKVPVLTIGAWILAEALLMMAVFVPMGVMSWWQQEANLLWWIGSLVSIALATLAGCWVARRLAGERGIDWLAKIMGKRLTGTDSFDRLHSGFVMLGNTRAAMIANAFRVLDILAFALRFYVAARVLELPISPSDSLLLGATYFMIGAASPFGMLGTREAGTIAIASLIGISSAAITEDQSGTVPIAATVLFVTAVEAVVNLGCAGFGIAWLRARPPLAIATQTEDEDESGQDSGL